MRISETRIVLQIDPRVAFLQLQAADEVHAGGVAALLTILPAQSLAVFKEATPEDAAKIVLSAPARALEEAFGTKVSSVQQASLVGLAGTGDTDQSWVSKNLVVVVIASVAVAMPLIVLLVFATIRRQRKKDAEQERFIAVLKGTIGKAAATPRKAWKDFQDFVTTPRAYKRGPPSPDVAGYHAAPTPHGGFGVFGSSSVPAETPHGGFGVFSSGALPRRHSDNDIPSKGHRISVTAEGDEEDYDSNESDESDENPEVFTKGKRVWHPARGFGRIIMFNQDDPRAKPYYIEFDTGEVHCYSKESAGKLRSEVSVVNGLVDGAKVRHSTHGEGMIVTVDEFDTRGKPVMVRFDNGEEHHYSMASAAKLEILTRSSMDPSRPKTPKTPKSGPATPKSGGPQTPRGEIASRAQAFQGAPPSTPKAGEVPRTPKAGEAPRTPRHWSLSPHATPVTPRGASANSGTPSPLAESGTRSPLPQTPRSGSAAGSPEATHDDDGSLTQPLLHGK